MTEEWNGELGLFDIQDANNIQFALRRLSNPSEIINYNSSGMDCGSSSDDLGESSEQEIIITITYTHVVFARDLINEVYRLPIDLFRNRLIEHFDIYFKQNKIRRPRSSVKR